MKIDRHNYEAFFILYMDNELAGEEKRQVEAFVELHPDLKEELELLMQFKLEPDTRISFEGKEELLKINGETPVTATNYEEWFTLYNDRELTPAQEKMVTAFIAENPALKRELELFQRAALQPESIIFPDKASLYRKEEKRRAAPVRWWRMAAAAVLIIGLGLATYSVLDKKPADDTSSPVAKTTEPGTTKQKPVDDPKVSDTPADNILAAEQTREESSPARESIEPNGIRKNPVAVMNDREIKNEPVIAASQNNNAPVVAKTNNLAKPLYNPNIDTQLPMADISTAQMKQKEPNRALTNNDVTTPTTQPSDIVNASFREDELPDQNDGKKNKLRGFFRKVTRTFDKRTNADATDDDHLLVAGLSIKLR